MLSSRKNQLMVQFAQVNMPLVGESSSKGVTVLGSSLFRFALNSICTFRMYVQASPVK